MQFSLLLVLIFALACNAYITPSGFGIRSTSLNAVTAAQVKELREKSGAGMLDCKKALTETDGNIDGAVDWLRKKGLASVQKKAGRTASTGLCIVQQTPDLKAASVLEMNCETDFVARNENFQAFVQQMGEIAASGAGTDDALLSSEYSGSESATVSDEITRLIATIGENMKFRRVERLTVDNGLVSTYMHMPTPGQKNMGKIGVAVAVESTASDTTKLQELGKNIAMHVAAQNPMSLNIDSLDPAALEREKNVLVEQAKASGKPEAAIEKMVEGRIRKFYEENCLMEQPFVMDGKVKVRELVESTAKELGAPISITGYSRMMLGEGIEKKDEE